jgi:hypothetical protein
MDAKFFRKYSDIITEAEKQPAQEAQVDEAIPAIAGAIKKGAQAVGGAVKKAFGGGAAAPAKPGNQMDPSQAGVTPDPKVAMGAQSVAKKLGAKGSGQMVAKGLGKVSKGQAVTGQMSQAIAPFVEPLEKILADPMLKQKFLNLIKQVQQ